MKKKTYAVSMILMAIILVAICAVSLVRVKSMEGQLEAYKLTADEAAQAMLERDEMAIRLQESESYVGAIRTERDAVNNVLTSIQTERDAANESLEAVQAERDAANAIAEAAKTERDILYKRLGEAYDRIIELETQLGIEPTVSALTEEVIPAEEIPAIAEPTAEPTEEPAPEATEEPAPEATDEPAAEPTEEPAAEPTEVPEEDSKPKPGH